MIDSMHDKREIDCVFQNNDPENNYFKVGQNGVTKIEIYGESGQCAVVPWCAVYQGDNAKWRFDMCGMGIVYK